MSDLFSYVIIGGIFLGGMIPLAAGIVHYVKENRAMGKAYKEAKDKIYA